MHIHADEFTVGDLQQIVAKATHWGHDAWIDAWPHDRILSRRSKAGGRRSAWFIQLPFETAGVL